MTRTKAGPGEPLKAGDILLAGPLGPMVALVPGNKVHATIAGVDEVGEVGFTYSKD